jgi:hypothetical protein
MYSAAEMSVLVGLLSSFGISIAEGASSVTLETLLPQLGVFAVVIVVFKFMLGRSDARDAEQDKRDHETMEMLKAQLAEELARHEETRAELLRVLRERRTPLVGSRTEASPEARVTSKVQRDIDDAFHRGSS